MWLSFLSLGTKTWMTNVTSFTFYTYLHSLYFRFLLLDDFSAGTPLKNWVFSDGGNLFSILDEKSKVT